LVGFRIETCLYFSSKVLLTGLLGSEETFDRLLALKLSTLPRPKLDTRPVVKAAISDSPLKPAGDRYI
jgi:hypothetical protein